MDMVNKTQDEASDLPASVKFIREHLGAAELSDDVMLILYHFAYTHLKYLNMKAVLSQNEKRAAKVAKGNVWKFVMLRVDGDRQDGKDLSAIKDKVSALLSSQEGFEPATSK